MLLLSYRKITKGRYAVYCCDEFVGEVTNTKRGWYFHTFDTPVFVSPVPSPHRYGAIVQWAGIYALSR